MWGVLQRQKNRLDGKQEYLMLRREGGFLLFDTRQQARDEINARFGYIRDRPDLRKEPHGWKMPIPVRVKITTAKGGKP